jgi:hypothetical protein
MNKQIDYLSRLLLFLNDNVTFIFLDGQHDNGEELDQGQVPDMTRPEMTTGIPAILL